MRADSATDLAAAQEEIVQLHHALASRVLIGQLVGMIMLVVDCDADTAWSLVVRESQRRHIKVRELAEGACRDSASRRQILSAVLNRETHASTDER